MDELEQLFPQFSLPAHVLEQRNDLTQSFCFTISSPDTEDLEMAISVSEVDGGYEVSQLFIFWECVYVCVITDLYSHRCIDVALRDLIGWGL